MTNTNSQNVDTLYTQMLTNLDFHHVIRGHKPDGSLHIDDLPPVSLFCARLVQYKVFAFVETDCLRIDCLKVVHGLQHFEVFCKKKIIPHVE